MNRYPTVLFLAVLLLPVAALGDDAIWDAIADGGHAVLVRHALAPGTGDPDNFTPGECDTQRNLSAEGRRQAQRIGALFRENGLDDIAVRTSSWCRALDTAIEMQLGEVTYLPPLDSFFRDRGIRETTLRGLREAIAGRRERASVVMVTHQVNISGIVGGWVDSGEGVVVRADANGEIIEVGRIPAPNPVD